MKFPNVKRYLSGILAAMLVLSSCGPTTTVYADEEDWPSLEEVIDQLDEDEIVRASDYEVAVGSDFNVHVDFANLDIPDPSRVSIYLDEAVNGDGEWFRTDHEDSFRTTYSVEPVSGHPGYRISRNIRVRGRSQGSTPAPQTTSIPKPSDQSVSSAESSSVTGGYNGAPENGGAADEGTKNQKTYDPEKVASSEEWQRKHDSQGDYIWETVKTYKVEDQLPLGHGEKSVMLIQCYIRLSMQEVMAIRWHMGFSEPKENYNSLGAAMEKYPLVLALHEADLEASKIVEVNC